MQNNTIEEDLKLITNTDIQFNALEGKNILITGANGFLPAYIVETILFLNETKFKEQATIYALVRNKEKALLRFSNYKNRKDLVLIVQDVIEPINLDVKMNYIIHAASQASPKYFGEDPVGTINANVIGTYNLLEYAKTQNIDSFLFFSSGEVYGNMENLHVPVKEDMYGYINPTDVRSCYAEGKRAGETMCVSYNLQFGIQVKIIRLFHTYGPGMSLDDGRVFADFVSNIVKHQDILVTSDGSTIRTFCYLSDATIAFFTVLLKGENGQAYNVANPICTISISNLAKILVELFPERRLKVIIKDQPSTVTYLKSSISGFIPDITKIENLGWKPEVSLENGFSRTIRSFESL